MPFPKDRVELNVAGYRFSTKSHCKRCKASIEFWITPKNRWMPLDATTLEPHWATCPYAKEFKGTK